MTITIREEIQSLKPYPAGMPIEELQRRFGLRRIIKLASNENDWGPSPRGVQAIRRALQQINQYPEGSVHGLRHALASRLRVSPQRLVFGNGSDELVILITLTFISKGDEIVVSRYDFPRYQMAAPLVGAHVRKAEMRNFHHQVSALLSTITRKTKAIFLSNPINPLGTMIGRQEVEQLLRRVPSRVLVVLDEAYREFVSDRRYPQTLRYLKRHPQLILLRTFSKAYGLAGLRVGYGIGHPEVIREIERVRPPFNVNRLAQAAAQAALEDRAFVSRSVKQVQEQRRWLYGEYQRLGLEFVPSQANFILVRLGQNCLKLCEQLLCRGIIVRPMAGFGLPEYARITIGKPQHNRMLIRELKALLKRGGKP
jgi:histidinol-phosphate aminotransferase